MFDKQQKKEILLFLINALLVIADTLIFSFVWYRFYSKVIDVPFS